MQTSICLQRKETDTMPKPVESVEFNYIDNWVFAIVSGKGEEPGTLNLIVDDPNSQVMSSHFNVHQGTGVGQWREPESVS